MEIGILSKYVRPLLLPHIDDIPLILGSCTLSPFPGSRGERLGPYGGHGHGGYPRRPRQNSSVAGTTPEVKVITEVCLDFVRKASFWDGVQARGT